MLKKRLSSPKSVARSGRPVFRLLAPRPRLRMKGMVAFVNGRIWLRMIGVASRTSGSTERLASSRRRNGGRSASSVGPSLSA